MARLRTKPDAPAARADCTTVGSSSTLRTMTFDAAFCSSSRPNHPKPLPPAFDRSQPGLYKDHMKTLTITDAKKNLSRWLAAASRGEDVGIVCGADIIALRKVEVESTDYAQREYGATSQQVAALEKATDRRYRKLKRSRKLVTVTAEQLRKMIG
jgi:antitoxin (DNA-binding transcriptional repressor) of toxin-antitoxin stability system